MNSVANAADLHGKMLSVTGFGFLACRASSKTVLAVELEMTPGIRPLIAGNWKMNGLRAQLPELAAIATGFSLGPASRMDVMVALPFTLIAAGVQVVAGTGIVIGAQDCHTKASGAHTGDVSAEMAGDAGAACIIVGHSERRTDHGESDATVRAKAEATLRAGLMPIVCIGETKGERETGSTLKVLERQLSGSLPDTTTVVIAYEPVWAIGTGLTPTLDDIKEAHAFIREFVLARDDRAGAGIRILYGGSVKPSNAREILAIDHVDGALVGGASLKADDFLGICAGCP
jgi:triosephosphate isomerase